MKKITAYGHITRGELKLFNRAVFAQQVSDIGFTNHCKLTMEYGNKRTVNMNAYAWAGIIGPAVVRLNQDGWEYTDQRLYREIEETFCKKVMVNETTGEMKEVIDPLKEKDTEAFMDIMMTFRDWFHDKYPDTYLKLPNEYYGMPYHIYMNWKNGQITMTDALQQSEEAKKDFA